MVGLTNQDLGLTKEKLVGFQGFISYSYLGKHCYFKNCTNIIRLELLQLQVSDSYGFLKRLESRCETLQLQFRQVKLGRMNCQCPSPFNF